MVANSRSIHGLCTDPPYAVELERARATAPFSAALEAEYVRSHLRDSRTLIRVVCVLSSIFSILRLIEHLFLGSWQDGVPVGIVLVAACSILLAALAWGPWFERWYPSCVRIIAPIRSAIAVSCIAGAAAHGQPDMLMFLSVSLLGPFFFLGMRFRTATVTGVVTVLSFAVSAIYFALPVATTLHATAMMCMQLVACVIAARYIEKQSRTSFLETRLIAQLAQQDALTGTKNRRVFDEHLARLWPKAGDAGHTMAILLIDVDHFKAYNDCYGHQAGDRALRRVAQTAQAFINGEQDLLARYGGEEFAAVLCNVDADRAFDIADRMRQAVEALSIAHSSSRTSGMVTISVGVAVIKPSVERSPHGALQLADQALYEAKVKGRNRAQLMNAAEYGMLVTGVFSSEAVRAVEVVHR